MLQTALALKDGGRSGLLTGKTLALVFEKPSLRTRVSFHVAMRQLGGDCIYLSPPEVGLGERESPADVARVLSRYVDCIAARTFTMDTVRELTQYAGVPVINALSDEEHPCQALADLLTIREAKGALRGVSVAFIGDGNNVANSLCLGAAASGMDFRLASPAGYEIPDAVLDAARVLAMDSGGSVEVVNEPASAVAGADVVYTDVWTSMGQERESAIRREDFMGFTVDSELMARAAPRRHLHARPAGSPRRRSDRRRHGRSAVRRVRPGRKPHARAEGRAGTPSRRR